MDPSSNEPTSRTKHVEASSISEENWQNPLVLLQGNIPSLGNSNYLKSYYHSSNHPENSLQFHKSSLVQFGSDQSLLGWKSSPSFREATRHKIWTAGSYRWFQRQFINMLLHATKVQLRIQGKYFQKQLKPSPIPWIYSLPSISGK